MSDLIEKVLLLQELLIARATDTYEKGSSEAFMQLRQELLTFKNFYEYIPFFIKDTRTLDEFEARIKWDFESYAERENYIYSEFKEFFNVLESLDVPPLDQVVQLKIAELSSDYIHQIWQKALERRSTDPEGAITLARTLLESTCKYILDEYEVGYGNAPDINQLYRLVIKELNLAPSQHTEQTFKQILGGCSSIIEGLGSLRNKVGDAHGQGKINFKPSPRHAELAVNLAGTMSVFLFSSWKLKQGE
ncbi:abortive infection family protein [Acinetobacter lwoffii]|uniref:abortive infection family protein n=2 Tax=Acinetobacter lwoffii TaxID=28090 RepID=UPI00209B05F5|nr:abortive infection family protein [Acinetobacter lwoffii]MCO8095628.1 abortive infection family protein [Acinetobacter lwoffii]